MNAAERESHPKTYIHTLLESIVYTIVDSPRDIAIYEEYDHVEQTAAFRVEVFSPDDAYRLMRGHVGDAIRNIIVCAGMKQNLRLRFHIEHKCVTTKNR